MDRSFAKPASRNTFLGDYGHPAEERSHYPSDVDIQRYRKAHDPGTIRLPSEKYFPLTTTYYRRTTPLNEPSLRAAASTGRLRLGDDGYSREQHVKPSDERPQSSHRQHSISSAHRNTPQVLAWTSHADRSDTASLSSTTRREDARQIFKEFGITRPQGWLSETDSGGRELRKLSEVKTYQLCHSCKVRVTSQKICSECGHNSCVKCTDGEEFDHTQTVDPLKTGTALSPAKSQEMLNISALRKASQTSIDDGLHRDHGIETPRPLLPRAEQPSQQKITHEELLLESPSGAQNRTDSETSLVNANPFILADRKTKAVAVAPEASADQAEGRPPTRMSDCIPQRVVSSSTHTSSNHVCDNNNCCDSRSNRHTTKGYTSRRRALKELAIHSNGLKGRLHDDNNVSEKDPLKQKIEELYYHAQDLHNSQHIMEHLAAGSMAMKNAEERPQDEAVVHVPNDPRLHSLTVDRRTELDPATQQHQLNIDEQQKIPQLPLHALGNDIIGDEQKRKDSQREHSLARDSQVSAWQQISPKSYSIDGDKNINLEKSRWSTITKDHRGNRRRSSNNKKRPEILLQPPEKLKPASPRTSLERPVKIVQPVKAKAARLEEKSPKPLEASMTQR